MRGNEAHVVSIDTSAGPRKATFINEPGLYRVIFLSRKAAAEKFQDWVFSEVLPSIRKTGAYLPTDDMTLEQVEFFGKICQDSAATKRENSRLLMEGKAREKTIQALEPDAGAFRRLCKETAGSMDFTDTAPDLKLTREGVIGMASNFRWIYSKNGRWKAYASAVRQGYMEVIETADGKGRYDYAPLITVKGRKKMASYLEMIRPLRAS